VGGIGGAAVAVLAFSLIVRWPTPLAWSLALLGAEYGAWLTERGADVDTRAPLYAAGLLLVAELAFDGIERRVVPAEPELVARRGLQLAGLGIGSIALGTVVLAAATIPLQGNVALTGVGVVAAIAAVTLVARLAK
jgi:hypothetical protein